MPSQDLNCCYKPGIHAEVDMRAVLVDDANRTLCAVQTTAGAGPVHLHPYWLL